MRVMVTGSRDWRDMEIVRDALETFDRSELYRARSKLEPRMTLIHGCASGLDAIARAIAVSMGWQPEDYWPDYASYDFAEANLLRNIEMIEVGKPHVVLAFPTRNSRGTWHAVNAAKARGFVEDKTLFIYSERSDNQA